MLLYIYTYLYIYTFFLLKIATGQILLACSSVVLSVALAQVSLHKGRRAARQETMWKFFLRN